MVEILLFKIEKKSFWKFKRHSSGITKAGNKINECVQLSLKQTKNISLRLLSLAHALQMII